MLSIDGGLFDSSIAEACFKEGLMQVLALGHVKDRPKWCYP